MARAPQEAINANPCDPHAITLKPRAHHHHPAHACQHDHGKAVCIKLHLAACKPIQTPYLTMQEKSNPFTKGL